MQYHAISYHMFHLFMLQPEFHLLIALTRSMDHVRPSVLLF